MPHYAAIILAAGRGERSGREDGPKQYRKVGGKPVIQWSVELFLSDSECTRILVARHADDEELCFAALGALADRVEIVIGGPTRQMSTLNALDYLTSRSAEDIRHVMIHDAARPFAEIPLLVRIKASMTEDCGILPSLPVSDTLKRGSQEGLVEATVSRSGLYAAQTPQAFPLAAIFAAHRAASHHPEIEFTDDASIAEWHGLPVRLVDGSPDNVKLTWKRDIDMANERLGSHHWPDVRTGNGYDVHSFVQGDHVWLGGVRIEHSQGLNGHSDSDVALHALTDALLATCSAGDIGHHFPPSDPQWKGCASSVFVRHAVSLIRAKGGRIANADISLICEAPRVGQHREAMVSVIADMMEISPERVSVKATTNEKLGFIGRKEGIAAIATATVVFPGALE